MHTVFFVFYQFLMIIFRITTRKIKKILLKSYSLDKMFFKKKCKYENIEPILFVGKLFIEIQKNKHHCKIAPLAQNLK